MNGFVLHVNNNLENQFSPKKNSLDCGQTIFLQQSILLIKNIGRNVK